MSMTMLAAGQNLIAPIMLTAHEATNDEILDLKDLARCLTV
jgi:hypothetical protein